MSLERHPVTLRDYRIPTPTLDAFYLLIVRSLRFKIHGSIIYGRSRFGKSSGIDFLEEFLASKDTTLPLIKLTCQRKKTPSESAFFSNMLSEACHIATSGGTPSALRIRLVNRLREIAERFKSNRIVLFVDDAQRLAQIEYEWLQEIHDTLAKHRVALVSFLVGTPLLRGQKSMFQSQGEDQIVARFMVDELPFRGLLSAQDCATCLVAYDVTEDPPRSGWSYTRFFLRKAFDTGLRLGDEGASAWDAFGDAHRQARLPGDVEIPMDYFTRAVEYILTEYVIQDNDKFRFNRLIWDEAVKYSGFTQALELISPGIIEP